MVEIPNPCHPYLLATIQKITTKNKTMGAPALMPIIAPRESPSLVSVTSGVKVIVGVATTDDVTDTVGVGVVNTLGGTTTSTTVRRKKSQYSY